MPIWRHWLCSTSSTSSRVRLPDVVGELERQASGPRALRRIAVACACQPAASKQRRGLRRIVGVVRHVGGVDPVERRHEAVGHRIAAGEQRPR